MSNTIDKLISDGVLSQLDEVTDKLQQLDKLSDKMSAAYKLDVLSKLLTNDMKSYASTMGKIVSKIETLVAEL